MTKKEFPDVGDKVRISGRFTSDNTDADPSTVVVKVRAPDGTITQPSPAHDSLGNYHADFVPTASGWWYYEVRGTGAVQAVDKGEIYVRTSAFE